MARSTKKVRKDLANWSEKLLKEEGKGITDNQDKDLKNLHTINNLNISLEDKFVMEHIYIDNVMGEVDFNDMFSNLDELITWGYPFKEPMGQMYLNQEFRKQKIEFYKTNVLPFLK